MDLPAPAADDQLLAVNEALAKFATVDARKAELVKLRYFVGLTFDEAAEVLGIAVPTAKQWWAYARAWLRVEIGRAQTAEVTLFRPRPRNATFKIEDDDEDDQSKPPPRYSYFPLGR